MAVHECTGCGDVCDCGGYDECDLCSECEEREYTDRGSVGDDWEDDVWDDEDETWGDEDL